MVLIFIKQHVHISTLLGVMTIVAVSWYASVVVRDFQVDQVTQNAFLYEFGPALYVGWISGVSPYEYVFCQPVYKSGYKLS